MQGTTDWILSEEAFLKNISRLWWLQKRNDKMMPEGSYSWIPVLWLWTKGRVLMDLDDVCSPPGKYSLSREMGWRQSQPSALRLFTMLVQRQQEQTIKKRDFRSKTWLSCHCSPLLTFFFHITFPLSRVQRGPVSWDPAVKLCPL